MNNTDDQATITLSISDEDGEKNKHTFEVEAITPANDDDEFWALLDDSGMPRLILTREEFREMYETVPLQNHKE